MVLNLEQLRAVTVGAARVEQQDSGFRFFRFTQAQEEAYQLRSADFYMKTFATANVRLEFETDSRELSLSVTAVPGSSRRFFAHDIYVGDRLIGQLGGKLEKDEEGKPIPCTVSNRFSLGNGTKTVRIYFPWSACSTLHALSLDDGSTLRPVPKKRTMLIFGDSITHGYDADHPSLSYANRLADALCANARNKGIGGEIFWPELAMRSDEDISPDLITVAYGTTIGRHAPKKNLSGIAACFTKPFPPVIRQHTSLHWHRFGESIGIGKPRWADWPTSSGTCCR